MGNILYIFSLPEGHITLPIIHKHDIIYVKLQISRSQSTLCRKPHWI